MLAITHGSFEQVSGDSSHAASASSAKSEQPWLGPARRVDVEGKSGVGCYMFKNGAAHVCVCMCVCACTCTILLITVVTGLEV